MLISMMVASLSAAIGAAVNPLPAESPKAAPANEPERVVCRKIAATGTRMGKRYCRPQREWDEQAEATRREFRTGETNGAKAENGRR